MSAKEKNRSLDGLRGVACLAVFSSHFLYLVFPYLQRGRTVDQSALRAEWRWEVWFGHAPFTLLYNGDLAVLVFFVLSGFVLLRKYWTSGDRTLLLAGAIKRYPRLVLPVAASAFFALSLMRLGMMHTGFLQDLNIDLWWKVQYYKYVSIESAIYASFVDVMFLRDQIALPNLNAPTWSVSVELVASFALFGAFFVCGRWKSAALAVFLVIGFAFGMPLYFAAFAIGASLNGAAAWLKFHPKTSSSLFVAGLIFGCFDYAFERLAAMVPSGFDPRTFWYVIAANLIVAGLIGSVTLGRFFGGRVCTYFGRISFSLYLLHWPILFSFSTWAVQKLEESGVSYLSACWLSYGATFILLIGLSEIFQRVVDAKSINLADWLANRISSRKRDIAIS